MQIAISVQVAAACRPGNVRNFISVSERTPEFAIDGLDGVCPVMREQKPD